MVPLEDPLAYIRHPHDVGLNSRLEVATLELRDGMKPANTSKTMEPKIEEFFQFCEKVYPNDQHNYNLDYEKVYRFMWYQAFREQKDQKSVRAARANGVYFDYATYKSMMDRFNADNPQAYPIPSKPIGKCTFNMYKACFRRIYKTQVARRVSSLPWDHIWQMGFDDLYSHVKERAPMIKRELSAFFNLNSNACSCLVKDSTSSNVSLITFFASSSTSSGSTGRFLIDDNLILCVSSIPCTVIDALAIPALRWNVPVLYFLYVPPTMSTISPGRYFTIVDFDS